MASLDPVRPRLFPGPARFEAGETKRFARRDAHGVVAVNVTGWAFVGEPAAVAVDREWTSCLVTPDSIRGPAWGRSLLML